MRRAIILGGAPYVEDYYRKDARTLFDETGGNSGNLAFRYAVAKSLHNPSIMSWEASPEAMRAAGDIIVLPLANQLGKHTDLGFQADRLYAFGLPVVGIGLGAQASSSDEDITLSEGTQRWLTALTHLSPGKEPNIGLRGAYTQAQIGRFELAASTAVMGCPSNFINTHDDIAAKIARGFQRKPERIGVAAGIPYVRGLGQLEENLADLASQMDGSYIVQHNLEMLRLARNEFDGWTDEKLRFFRDYIRPKLSVEAFISWCRDHAIAFYDVRAWMDYLTRFDIVIGTRFHGAMLAIQAGVPAACISHDSRTHEMCVTMGIPVRHHTEITEPLTHENLLDYFSFDPSHYRELRNKHYQTYKNIYQAAEVHMSQAFSGFTA